MKYLRFLPAIFIAALLIIGACSPKSHSTYGSADTVQADTTKDKFSNAEKTGAVLFVLFVIYATENSQ